MTNKESFVHLHVHSEYSLLEASASIKGLVQQAVDFGMPAMALTDNGNMFGAIEFYFACLNKGIKPILGLDTYLVKKRRVKERDEGFKPLSRLVLLATSYKGYQSLCQISSAGYQEGFYYKPRIDEEVLEKFNEDVIALTGGLYGIIPQTFLTEGPEAALSQVRRLKEIFSDRLYLEINDTKLPQWKRLGTFLKEASKITGVPLVAANDVHYQTENDQMSQEVLLCIGSNKTLHDETRFRLGSGHFYLKSSEEMRKLFRGTPEVCDRTLEVAERVHIKFQLKDKNGKPIYHLPSFPTQGGVSLFEEICRQSKEGLEIRFTEAQLQNEPLTDENKSHYYQRLNYELSVIDQMGFNGYFLIVADFVNWAKNQDIPVGPGRGSGVGSLVAYSLRITDIDPIPHSLFFERFLTPERISMPDFDIDFCQERRQEVIQYVTEKYGEKSVSQIITYGKLQCRAALKDVGRVLGISFADVNAVTALVPEKLSITIDEALGQEPRLKNLMEAQPATVTLIDLARKVEGLVRHAGIHAAGVIIASDELVKYAPLYRGTDGENVVQYDMKHAEKIGLIKFDFLGLKTLTHIHRALKLILKNKGKKINSRDISIHDPGIYEIIGKGDTAGIFQFEGDGITNVVRLIKPTSFFDITAINALYRPGPMGMIPEFAKRKHGEAPVEFILDEVKDVLKETYGIIVYQEQVMGIASRVAGYSLGEADMLRRAMSKKIKTEMDQHRERFLRGARERNFDEEKAEDLFELMYKFADYGFNKSHAAAYCVISAQTAWLKKYYPAEFYAALLSMELGDTNKVVQYVKDAQRRGLNVLPPHVNHSDFLFTVKGEDIYYGLGAIKGVGESAVTAILSARDSLSGKQFSSIEEFFSTVDIKKINKRVIEVLVKAGAFDGFGVHRAQLYEGFQKYVERAEGLQRDREVGQISLFNLAPSENLQIELNLTAPWARTMALAYEKDVLGFYLSDHPLRGFEQAARVWTSGNISDLANIYEDYKAKTVTEESKKVYDFRNKDGNKKRVTVVGLMTETREIITKKGSRMAFSKVEDLSGSCELLIFPDVYAQFEELVKDERPLLVGGYLDRDGDTIKIIVDNMVRLEEAIKKTRKVVLHLDGLDNNQYVLLARILRDYPGSTQVDMVLNIPDLHQNVFIESPEVNGVSMENELLEKLQAQFGRTDFMEMKI